MTSRGGQPVTGSRMVADAFFSLSFSFQRFIYLLRLIQTEFRAQATPAMPMGRSQGEKDRERPTKNGDAQEEPDPASQGVVASAHGIAA